jgi:hypothetical protein
LFSFSERFSKTRARYQRFQRFIPVLAFFSGVIWDHLTLSRIDALLDNLIVFIYIVLLGTLIILQILADERQLTNPYLLKYSKWFPTGIQFFMGGLFSTYVVFYFQSASFTKTSIFLIILILLLVANEFLARRLSNTYLILSLYFFSCFSYFTFFIPVLTKVMNIFIFIVAGLISLFSVAIIFYVLYRQDIYTDYQKLRRHAVLIIILYSVLNLFYWFNWIPPVPLSVKQAGIYHHASRQNDLYRLKYERPRWYQFYRTYDRNFSHSQGDTVFCFVSVFAPTKLTKKIVHHWQFYIAEQDKWITTDRHGYVLTGGRDGGYRGYTYKRNIQPGAWRVNVETEDKLLLSRVDFDVCAAVKELRSWRIVYK